MKALTLYQPWATLVALGEKKVETRSWWTGYTGPLAIHASKNSKFIVNSATKIVDDEYYRQTIGRIYRTTVEPPFPLGCIVAICELEGCVQMVGGDGYRHINNWIHLGEQEIAFGYYEAGRYMWFIKNVTRLNKPIYISGQLGLWEWTEQEKTSCAKQSS